MRARLPILTAALLSVGLPAWGQGFTLPDGPEKERVANTCGACHPINRLGAGYTPEGWRTVERMMRNMEAPVPPDEWPAVTAYLTKAFPEKPRPPAVLIDGPVQATITEWPVPTPGSRPHDPMAAKDGSIWYTGQLANVIGRVDPQTGKIREYTMKTPHTAPHGLVEDTAGNIWFTGNNAGLMGKLDPKTGAVTEYPLPDPEARDPHSLVFDKSGILWFTVQQANLIGRLDPKAKDGAIKLIKSPTPNSRPYGIQVNARGVPILVEFGANKIASVDPQSLKIREWSLPDPAARPRRLAIAPDDTIWYTDFARGFLGQLDPKTGKVREWQSPSGPTSQPYGIVFTKGALWYSESFAKPNTVVRFDPKTEKFQTWAIPGGGDIVRNMDVTRDGNPVLANSLTNQVGLVAVK
ncbi:MAG: cytochrome C [Alphaproteobacteria bacterium]|nr:cytochrome C [Alphaproteobacteria bacterium]